MEILVARRKSPLGKIPHQYYLDKSKHIKDFNGKPVRGLFTRAFIKKGELIGEYRGVPIDERRSQTKKKYTQYFFAVYDDNDNSRIKFVIDGAPANRSSFLRYINAPNKKYEANTRFVQVGDAILLYAIKPIQAHTELLAWYGKHTRQIIRQH